MKKAFFYTAALAVLIFFQFSCAFLSLATSSWIERKLERLPPGVSDQNVRAEMGEPVFRIRAWEREEVLPAGRARRQVDIWGYEVGHYWYHETCFFFFRQGRLIGAPRDPYDLLKMLHALKLMPDASFWRIGMPPAPAALPEDRAPTRLR